MLNAWRQINTKYNRNYLLSEIERFIKENGVYPKSENMRVKYSYPPISAYTDVFKSWQKAIDAYEDTLFPIRQVDPNIIDKYSLLCQNEIFNLALKYPHISMLEISKILESGYQLGISAAMESFEVELLKDNYL